MNNLDKDIEIEDFIKEVTERIEFSGFRPDIVIKKEKAKTAVESLEEYEQIKTDYYFLKNKVNWYSKEYDKLFDENNKLSKELETYKKIAEKLATELRQADNGAEQLGYYGEFANKPTQCIIDWARKEVEKDD